VVFRERRARWKGALAGLIALVLLAGSALVALARARETTPPATGRIVLQALRPAHLRLDGTPRPPQLRAGEFRSLEVAPGRHRIELVGADGRSAAATVYVDPGEVSELLRIELR